MAAALPTVSLYATRWKPLLAALGFAGGVVVAVLWYFVWPTPMILAHGWEYQEPVKTVVFVVILVGSAAFTLLALYWVVTPLPLLQLTASSFTYRPFPLPKRVINWDDMEYISAFTWKRAVNLLMDRTMLTVTFTLKPQCALAPAGRQQVQIDISPANFSRKPEELVCLLRDYHAVQFDSALTKKARRRAK